MMKKTGRDEILSCLIELVKKQFQDSIAYREGVLITADTDIFRELEFDSLMLVVLQVDIEDAFQIRFNPIEVDMQTLFSTVGSLAEYISRQIETGAQDE